MSVGRSSQKAGPLAPLKPGQAVAEQAAISTRSTAKAGLRLRLMMILLILSVILVLVIILAVSLGSTSIPFDSTFSVLLSKLGLGSAQEVSSRDGLIIDTIRLPRVLIACLVGAALALSGSVMQGLFRNPLADPGIIGVSTGGALGAVLAIAFGWTAFSYMTLPITAFLGAILTAFSVYTISRLGGRQSMTTLLLAGIAISALLGAVISALVTTARNDQVLRGIVFWLQGGLESRTWEHVGVTVLPVIVGAVIITFFGRDCNLLLLGEESAKSMGVRVERTRLILLALTSLITGAAVAVSGVIGFVGLIVPHIMRQLVGPDHRVLLPASALAGSIFLVLCDLIARTAFQPSELRVGVFTAFLGAPFFLYLILRGRKAGGPLL